MMHVDEITVMEWMRNTIKDRMKQEIEGLNEYAKEVEQDIQEKKRQLQDLQELLDMTHMLIAEREEVIEKLKEGNK
jgi:DNA-binding transcriptional regulator GbsR (MarR family)